MEWQRRIGQRRELGGEGLAAASMVGVALVLLEALGLDDLSRKALLVQAAAPSAVLIILATEFNARPRLATSTVLVSGTRRKPPRVPGGHADLSSPSGIPRPVLRDGQDNLPEEVALLQLPLRLHGVP